MVGATGVTSYGCTGHRQWDSLRTADGSGVKGREGLFVGVEFVNKLDVPRKPRSRA